MPIHERQSPLGGTLHGIRVLDLTRNLAGPYCTMVLGDLGADVIKIERPHTGDDSRGWSPPAWNGVSTVFLSANRNKRSVTLDLDNEAALHALSKMAGAVDVIVESFRPGSLKKRGLDYETIRARVENRPAMQEIIRFHGSNRICTDFSW